MAAVERRGGRGRMLAAFATVYLVWGSTYLAIRFGLETMPPFLMAGVRFLVAGTLLYGWARARGADRPTWDHWKVAATAGVLLLAVGNGGVTWAERSISSGLAALLVASEPLWLVLLAWGFFGGARPTGKIMAGLALGLLGVASLVVPGGELAVAGSAWGMVAVLVATVSWAVGSLLLRDAKRPDSPILGTGMQMLAGSAVLIAVGLARGEARGFDPAAVSTGSLLALLYLIVFGSIAAYTAYTWLLTVTTPARASTYAYVNPVVAVLLGHWLGAEKVSPIAWVSMAVIVGSVALVNTAEGPKSPPETRSDDEPEPESAELSEAAC